MNNSEHSQLIHGLESLSLTASEQQITSLLDYCGRLEETNRSFNLTRIPRADYVTLHLLDSLTCLPLIGEHLRKHSAARGEPTNLRLIDVGTGAGFPAVPIAALLPRAHIIALDSTLKKVRWVEQTAHAVGITNLSGIHARAEALSRTAEHQQQYDVVVSRAVAPLVKLTDLILPFLSVGGTALAMKGQGFEAEVDLASSRIEELGCKLERIHEVQLPGTDIRRFILVIQRHGTT